MGGDTSTFFDIQAPFTHISKVNLMYKKACRYTIMGADAKARVSCS